MNPVRILLLFGCIASIGFFNSSHAQTSEIWYFGGRGGISLDFNSGSPTLGCGNPLKYSEGTSTITDEAGNLLFSSDGRKIYDKDGNSIPSTISSNIRGDESSAHSVVIVPNPGDLDQYYVFTAGSMADINNGGNWSPHYSIVDVGLATEGDIVPGTKNTLMPGFTASTGQGQEKLAVTLGHDGSYYWIATVRENGANDQLLMYKLDISGLSLESTTALGTDVLGQAQMKISPQGDKIAISAGTSIAVVDFDNSDGSASVDRIHSPGHLYGIYGVEFSPDGSKIYTSQNQGGSIYVTSLPGYSSTTVSGLTGEFALELGPDGNIYYIPSSANGPTLGAITAPNGSGTHNSSFINFSDCPADPFVPVMGRGLPTIVPRLCAPPVAGSVSLDQGICHNQSASLELNGSSNVTTYVWEKSGDLSSWSTVGAGNITNDTLLSETLTNTSTLPDTIWYRARVTNICNADTSDTVRVIVSPFPAITATPTDPSCTLNDGSILITGLAANWSYVINYDSASVASTRTLTTNGAGQVTINGLDGQDYENIQTSINGCLSNLENETLTDPVDPTFSINITQPDCDKDNGELEISGLEATTGYTVSYTGPTSLAPTAETTSGTGTITYSPLAEGSYSNVTVDSAGCSTTLAGPFVLTNPLDPTFSVNITQPDCDKDNGELEISGLEATTGYTVSYTGPTSLAPTAETTSGTGTITYSPLAEGSYSNVTVDSAGTRPQPITTHHGS